ncbi:FAD-dependent oxidoreductase [Streptomyces chrestomyceticus]|uniref:FAD-dependent oxidoreductase n=1 Tax=Streptomyces chrestomyceticus TaxID=68185 RepID=UPI003F4D080A
MLDRLREIVAELGIECDLEQLRSFTYAAQPGEAAGAKVLQAEAKAAEEAGLRATYVEETGLPYAVGRAVCVADQAQFHPRSTCSPLVLADDFRRFGGAIHERTRVTDLSEGSPCKVTSESGHTVTAEHVYITEDEGKRSGKILHSACIDACNARGIIADGCGRFISPIWRVAPESLPARRGLRNLWAGEFIFRCGTPEHENPLTFAARDARLRDVVAVPGIGCEAGR